MKWLSLDILNVFSVDTAVNRPLMVLALVYISGILVSGVLKPGLFFIFFLACISLILGFAGLISGWRATGGLILGLAFFFGVLAGGLAWKSIDYSLLRYCNHFVTIEGKIDRAPEFRQNYIDYVIQVQQVKTGNKFLKGSGRVLVKVEGKDSRFGYGDMLRVKGILRQPESPGNPGEFNYQRYLARRGIVTTMTVKPGEVEKLGGIDSCLMRFTLVLRDKIMQVTRETLSPVHAAMLNGMMFGSRGEIPRDLQEAFSESGLAHLLCVSGLHVGLVLGGLLMLLRMLGVSVSGMPFIATPVLFFYAAMTGFGPAVLRAAVMALLLLWAHCLGRERDWPTTLAVAALVVLAVNPLQIYEAGFQLSFTATWGILYLGPWLQKKMEPLPLPVCIKSVLWVTVAAQLGTLPVIINNFNVVSLASVLTNIVALPLAGIILFMGFLAGFCGLVVPVAASAVNAGTGILLGVYEWIVILVRDVPGAFRYMAPWPWWAVILWYLGLVAVVEWPRVKQLHSSLNMHKFIALVIALLLALLIWTGAGSDRLEVHFIDVGQGDSILVRLPGGKDMLVDAGGWPGDFDGEPGVGDYVVVPYLKRLGINRLEAVLITHFHEDHAGGVQAVIKSFDVHRLIIPRLDPETASDSNVKAVLTKARLEKIPVNCAGSGDKLRLDRKVNILFLGPRKDLYAGSRSDYNNNSLVLMLDYKETEILLTGDIEKEMQSWLVQQGNLVPVEVLKVPHHGSRFSSPDFFKQVHPGVAVICVGERNRFNFPSWKIVSQLKDLGTRVYRTDRDGAVIISSDGNSLTIKTGR